MFRQGDASASITITKGNTNSATATVNGKEYALTKIGSYFTGSYTPSALVEMGFRLNLSNFGGMYSRQGIYDTVTAISDRLIAALT